MCVFKGGFSGKSFKELDNCDFDGADDVCDCDDDGIGGDDGFETASIDDPIGLGLPPLATGFDEF